MELMESMENISFFGYLKEYEVRMFRNNLGLNSPFDDDYFHGTVNDRDQYIDFYPGSSINNNDDNNNNNKIIKDNDSTINSPQNIEIVIDNNERSMIGKKRIRKNESDNIIKKSHGHFLDFIINLINLILRKQNIKIDNIGITDFKKINIKEKKKIIIRNIYKIIQNPISNFLELKNTRQCPDEYHNKKLYNKIKDKDNAVLQKVLDMKYMDLFKKFYANEKDKKSINVVEDLKTLEIGIPYTYEYFLNDLIAKGDDKYKNKCKKVIEKNFLGKIPYKKRFIVKRKL